MKTKISFLLIFSLLFMASFINAQEDDVPWYKFNIAGANVYTSLPRGIFQKNTGKNVLWGGELYYLRQYEPDKPFFIGGRFGYQYIEGASAVIPRINLSGIEEWWDGQTTSALMRVNASARYYFHLSKGNISPYFHANMGMNWFYTSTTLTFADSDESFFDMEKSDVAFNYSGGIGANYAIDYHWHLHLFAELDSGQSAFYYVRRDEDYTPRFSPVEKLALKKSVTNSLGVSVGIMYRW